MKLRFFQFLVALLQRTGLKGTEYIGRAAGALLWFFLPGRRGEATRRVRERLNCPEEEARRIARASFTHISRAVAESLQAGLLKPGNPRLRIETPELFHQMTASERPVVIITGHFGAWELSGAVVRGAVVASRPRPLLCIARRQKDPDLTRVITDLRNNSGFDCIDHRDCAPAVLACLRQKGIASFLVDHNTRRNEAVFLPFLGKTAAVNMGPALLALRGKALVFPYFLQREEDGMYTVLVQEALDAATVQGSLQERIRIVADFYTRAMEKQIRKRPEQWFWMHRRWKTRPPEEEECTML